MASVVDLVRSGMRRGKAELHYGRTRHFGSVGTGRSPYATLGGLVVGDGAEDQAALVEFLRVGEAGLTEQGKDRRFLVVGEVLAGVEDMREEAVLMRFGIEEVEEMEGAAGAQNAANFAESFGFFCGRKMVVHEGGEDAIEGGIGIREFVGKAAIKLNVEVSVLGFGCGAGEGLGIGVETNDRDVGVKALDEDGHGAGAAADVEEAHAGLECGLIDERPARGIAAKKFDEGVVEGKSPVFASGGEVRALNVGHDF